MNSFKRTVAFLLAAGALLCAACTETPPPEDSNLPASGAPQDWEGTMPGMGGFLPQDR